MDEIEYQRLKDGVRAALASERLPAWERRFLGDIEGKLAKFGKRTRLSAKQRRKLDEILGARAGAKVVPLSRPRGGSKPAGRRATGRGRFRARRLVNLVAVSAGAGVLALAAWHEGLVPGWQPAGGAAEEYGPYTRRLSLEEFSVTDGDTIRIAGERYGTRLVGFNTPETFDPVCARGEALGRRATARLEALVRGAAVIEVEKVPCACPAGTHGTEACNYGRSCGILRVDGADVGEILIAEGLAAPFRCGGTGCPPTPRPWCE